MAEKKQGGEIVRVIILCVFWYIVSSSNNVVGKTILNEFPYPMTVTMVQLVSITLYSGPVLKWMRVRKRTDISWPYYKKIILPLALGKFLSSVSSHVSIWKVPVSYAHTVKATMPLFTVLLARIIFREKQSMKVYMSLVPIVLGVAIATITEISFDVIGLAAALLATCGFSLQNIFSKKVLLDTGIHHLRLLHLLGKLSLFMFLPIWIFSDGYTIAIDSSWFKRREPVETFFLLFLDGMLNWLQNLLAFTILHYVTPLTYAVANCSKRITVIAVSLIMLRNPVTVTNVLGMLLAILGVLAYNKAKYDANKAKKRAAALPLSQVSSSKPLHIYSGMHTSQQPVQNHPAYLYTYSNGIPASGSHDVQNAGNAATPIMAHGELMAGQVVVLQDGQLRCSFSKSSTTSPTSGGVALRA
ncbi:solute carrier family 35 member E1 homolog isoform X2 [Oratosquilla oratoria]|uniref:solute carrier family 35 member E1 homolog isoform X2 n=1 Tax=Oratosquilla oratoria TaxID=337810 RepID=UPI003F76C70D